ncbi:MAG TPA: hypothetical protein VKV17_02430 [Bryobacteraceae bacterium]|nr:hypothetical protein [Bryobacteraceae bacterium]
MKFQRTANSVLTVCLSPGDNPRPLRMLQLLASAMGIPLTTTLYSLPCNPTGIPPLALAANISPPQFNSYYLPFGGTRPQPQTIAIYPESLMAPDVDFTVSFSTNSGGNWLSVTPASGTTCNVDVDCSAAPTLTVSANPAGLAVGTYQGVITITPQATKFQPAGPPVEVAVGLTITDAPIANQIVSGVSFQGGLNSQTFSITPDQLAGPFTVNVLTDSGGNWLSATPTSGTTPAQITVSATPGSLGPGIYAGLVTVQGANGGVFAIPATLSVPGAQLVAGSGSTNFVMGPGDPPPAPQTITIANPCLEICPPGSTPNTLPFTATVATHSGGDWLSVTTAAGWSSVTLSVNPAGLAPGIYTGVVTLTPSQASSNQASSSQGAATQIPVTLNIWTGPSPALVASPPIINVSASPFSTVPVSGSIQVQAGYREANLSSKATTSNGGNWLTVHSTVPTPGIAEFSIDASQLAAGVYKGDIIFSAAGQTLDVPVTLTVAPPQPNPDVAAPAIGTILNAASGTPGGLSPGGIISIHGFGFSGPSQTGGGVLLRRQVSSTVPTEIGGVELLINGQPAPLLDAGPWQVNAIVPYEVAGKNTATAQLIDVAPSPVWSIPIVQAAPGIFTRDSTGAGEAAVLNQDNSVNGPSNPAARGSVIQIFATGIPVQGAVTGSITPGPLNNATPAVSVFAGGASEASGGIPADVLYAGPAPGEVAGLVQINAVIPANAPTGPAVPLVFAAGGQQSQTTATIAIQ